MQFKHFPHLYIKYAIQPTAAEADLSSILDTGATDVDSAARILSILVQQGRKAGLQLFLTIEHPRAATPEAERLNMLIRRLTEKDHIYHTAPAANYDFTKLSQLLQS